MTFDLSIARYRIRLHSDDGVILKPDERFGAFVTSSGEDPDLNIRVTNEKAVFPPGAKMVFKAPLLEETHEGQVNSGEPFWEVASDNGATYVGVTLKNPSRNPLLVIPKKSLSWQLFADSAGQDTDALPYPLDGLILYYLTSLRGGIMVHGSGVVSDGRGWIFTGKSGSGKTTMAMILDRCGDRVIHDDRLILVREGDKWIMHSTPVYRNDEPRSAEVHHIWIISHGKSNISSPLSGAEAAGMIMANCIQQNWDRDSATRLTEAVENLASSVRVSRLAFLPDSGIREYLSVRESGSYITASLVTGSILAEDMGVIITAGGYSMWPVLRPGDRITINPFNRGDLTEGKVVALRRDGGFVVHRITEVNRDSAFVLLQTRGDTSLSADPWITEREVAGVVTSVCRREKVLTVKARRMPYLLGRLLAVAAGIMERFKT